MDRSERPSRGEKHQVTPEPTRPDLFEFIEQHFEGSAAMPQYVELRQAYGPGGRNYSQTAIFQKEYKPNAAKPSRSDMVDLSNKFIALAQQNCNELGKPHGYGVLFKSFIKSDAYYGVYYMKLRPTQPGNYDPLSPEDDEDIPSDGRRRDGLLQYGIDHIKQSDENERWRQDQFSSAMGDILAKYQDLATQVMQHNLEMQKEHRELFKIADEALSRKAERELAAEMQKFKIGMLQDGFQFLRQLAPVAINQLTGKKTVPTEQSPESIAVQTFLEGLTDVQSQTLFGELNEDKTALKPTGIFTPEQAAIFLSVAQCTAPATELDRLLEGDSAVTPAQIEKAQSVVSSQQFLPLVALVLSRKKQQLSPPSENTSTPVT